MKTIVVLSSLAILITFTGFLQIGGNAPAGATDSENKMQSSSEKPTWEIPIAAGVWYPSDGAVPDHPMRYYRVRCWPGCHTGSNYGKYPQKALNDKAIFPTSAAGAHPTIPAVKE